jgi:uncharacterized membrane protein YhhN
VRRRTAAALLTALTTTHLAAQLRGPNRVADVTQALLMPAVGSLLASRPGAATHARRAVAVGLATSFAGDTAPRFARGDDALRVTIVCFAGTHLAYLVGLGPTAWRRLRRRPRSVVLPVLGYAALVGAVQHACAPRAREAGLAIAVGGYGALLGATGVVTALAGPRLAVGGALFALSDAMIALGRFVRGWHPRVAGLDVHDALIMATYVGAQVLIADGVTRPCAHSEHHDRYGTSGG